MALSKTIELNSGITCENAYIKIVGLGGNKEVCSLSIGIFKDKTYADGNNYIQILNKEFIPSVADDAFNFIKQGYEYLKTTNEYNGATDC